MAKVEFSFKEAIGHGWAMTKKYFRSIFVFVLIYLAITIANSLLESFAGNKIVACGKSSTWHDDDECLDVVKDNNLSIRLNQFLIDEGYINKFGTVEDKLQKLTNPNDLILPPELQNKHTAIFDMLQWHRYRLPFPEPIYYFLAICFWMINIIMSIGFIKIFLSIARDTTPTFSDYFSNWGLFIPYLLGTICYGFTILGGILLLIIPGIIFIYVFLMTPYLIVDKGMGPIEAMKHSRVITKGNRCRLALFSLVLIFLNIGGFLCLLIGVLFTMSISYVASAYVYDQLVKAEESVTSTNEGTIEGPTESNG